MANVNYNGIKTKLAEVIRDNCPLLNMVEIEAEVIADIGRTPWAGVYMTGRTLEDSGRGNPLAAGQVMRYNLRFAVWVFGASFESLEEATNKRDAALPQIEAALMGNRTLDDTVNALWIEGGDFQSAVNENDGSYIMGAETIVNCAVTASI